MLGWLKNIFSKESPPPRIREKINLDDWVLPEDVEQAIRQEFINSIKLTAEKNPEATIGCMCGECSGRINMVEYYQEVLNQTERGKKDTDSFIKARKNIAFFNNKTVDDLIAKYKPKNNESPTNTLG